jgi:hypothetical protein
MFYLLNGHYRSYCKYILRDIFNRLNYRPIQLHVFVGFAYVGIRIRLRTGILESYYRDLYRGVFMSSVGIYTVVFRSTVMGIHTCVIRFTCRHI